MMKYLKYLLIITIILSSSILTAYAYIGNEQASAVSSANEIEYIKIIVEEGDSVWNLAQKYNSENYSIRKLVSQIKTINGLEQYAIFPGQELLLPL